ncbi:MAG: AraC family transcriptional regulator [Firmicutes bacterium]|nr:AraC family transcriptional regulator [Bacillota bacterium]NLL87899.1 AraC family transcriptional regulator [Bacillota bacterium]
MSGVRFAVLYNKLDTSYTMPYKHEHEHYEIYYLISGDRFYFIEDQIYHVHQGDLVFISKGYIHRTTEADSSVGSHARYVVYFTEELLQHVLSPAQVKELLSCFHHDAKVIHLTVSQQNFIEGLLTKMISKHVQQHPNKNLYQQILLVELLLFANQLNFDLAPNYFHDLNPIYHTIHQIIQYIRKHYQEKLSLAKIAEQFYISPYYLSRMFKQVTGLTLTEYLNNTRIKAAQQLLLTTHMPISEISEQAGYESHTHFSRVFKQFTNLSPMQYRKANTKAEPCSGIRQLT